MFNNELFDHQEHNENKNSFIFEVNKNYTLKLRERDEDYLLDLEIMIIEFVITGKMQHKLRAKYVSAACSYSRKQICLFHTNKHYMVLGHRCCFYFDRWINLVKLHRTIRFKSFFYVLDTSRFTLRNASSSSITMSQRALASSLTMSPKRGLLRTWLGALTFVSLMI